MHVHIWNAKLTYTQLVRELFKYLESSLIQLKRTLIDLENSPIKLESALIEELSNSIRVFSTGMCTIRERTNSFTVFWNPI